MSLATLATTAGGGEGRPGEEVMEGEIDGEKEEETRGKGEKGRLNSARFWPRNYCAVAPEERENTWPLPRDRCGRRFVRSCRPKEIWGA